jgi:hypothetical protein
LYVYGVDENSSSSSPEPVSNQVHRIFELLLDSKELPTTFEVIV